MTQEFIFPFSFLSNNRSSFIVITIQHEKDSLFTNEAQSHSSQREKRESDILETKFDQVVQFHFHQDNERV